MPSFLSFPRPSRLRDQPLAHRQRPERARLELGPQVIQELLDTDALLDQRDGHAVHAGRVRAPVALDPAERHVQRRRVKHEVEQVIEPAARIGRRPAVKLGLHPRYPRPRPGGLILGAAIRRRVLRHCSLLPFSKPLPPFPMCRALPGSEYYGGSAPPQAGRPTASPARANTLAAHGRAGRDGSRVHCDSLGEGGAQLYPCGLATATPQHFTVASQRTS
jgi:hypothetical protein